MTQDLATNPSRPGLLRFAPLTALGVLLAAGVISEINAPVSMALSAPGTGIPRDQLNLIRCVGGALALLIAVAVTKRSRLRVTLRELPLFAAIGAIGIGVVQFTFTRSLAWISSGAETFFLLGMAVPIIAIISSLLTRRVQPAAYWVGIGVSLAGLILLGLVWESPGLTSAGVLFGLVSGAGRAVFFLAGQKALRDRDTLSTSFWSFSFAGLFWILVAGKDFTWSAFAGEVSLGGQLAGLTVPRWLALTWEPAIGTALLFTLLLAAIRYLPPTAAAHFGLLEAVVATAIFGLWFQTPITGVQVIGAIAILAGIGLTLHTLLRAHPNPSNAIAVTPHTA